MVLSLSPILRRWRNAVNLCVVVFLTCVNKSTCSIYIYFFLNVGGDAVMRQLVAVQTRCQNTSDYVRSCVRSVAQFAGERGGSRM